MKGTGELQENTIPDWMLERYRLGELTPGQLAKVETALRTDPLLSQRLHELSGSDQAIFEKYPVTETARLIREKYALAGTPQAPVKASRADRQLHWFPLGITAMSVAAALCFFSFHAAFVFCT